MKINRLNKHRVYLAGAIDRVKDRGIGWREKITPFLRQMGIIVYNPINKTTEVGIEDENIQIKKNNLKAERKYDDLSSLMREIRSVDLRLVDISDFLIVSLDLNTHPCGTYEEIFLANRSKKPILIHVEQGKEHAPDWLFGAIPHDLFFSSWDEIKEYLAHINSSEVVDSKRRWLFFHHD
jgi:hypothetical protein